MIDATVPMDQCSATTAVGSVTMSDGEHESADDRQDWQIERAVLNESLEGREISAGFVRFFGAFLSNEVRPLLRRVANDGGEPQLLMNGLAALLRSTADEIEFPLDHPRAGSPAREET
jgi:hypothetical protein